MRDIAVPRMQIRRPRSGLLLVGIRHALLLFAAAFFLARLPFLFAGYGSDTDAYRVALSALYLWSSGEYLPSRLPGYPLHDLATALLIWGGPVLTNLFTAIVAFIGVILFDRIVLALHVPGRPWLLVAMGFTPWLLVNSTTTIDYHWALTAMLASYLAVIRNRPTLAGVLLGIAGGFRITAIAFALPLLLLLVTHSRLDRSDGPPHRHARSLLREICSLCAATTIVLVAAYAPVLWTYGLRFWSYAPSSASPDVIIQMVGQRALGVIGALVTIAVVALSWRRLLTLPHLIRSDPHVLMWILTVLIYALIFLRLPVDAGYLIPIYPFAFLLIARVLARWALATIVIAVLLSGVVDLTIQGIHNFSPAIAAREVRPSWKEANLWHDYRTRTRWQSYAERIAAADVPPHSVVLTLGAFPDVAVVTWDHLRYAIVERDLDAVSMLSDNGVLWDDERDIAYLAVSEPEVIARLVAQGYALYRAEPIGPDWQVRLVPIDAPMPSSKAHRKNRFVRSILPAPFSPGE